MNLFHNQEKEKRCGLLKKASFFIFVMILMFVSFVGGLYVSEKEQVSGKTLAQRDGSASSTGIFNFDEKKTEGLTGVDFNLFWDLWDVLKEDYVDQEHATDREMFYGALKGMADSLNDPYTVFMDPVDSEEFENGLSGTFEGIGCEVGIRDDLITVVAPLNDSPAEKAGLLPGDRILSVDGEPTLNMTIDEAVSKIRGEKGTVVTLTIYRGATEETKDIDITRDEIYIKSVSFELREDGLFLLEINSFNEDTLELFNKAIYEIVKTEPKGIILDLRSNPGGFLDTSIEIASEWIEEGPIVEEVFSTGRGEVYTSRGKALLKDYPTVVLVNGGSASASEIVAGALQDYEKASVVGEKTFGKGSVQVWRGFNDGSSVKVTTAKWLTPNGTSINDDGITPEFEVEYTFEQFQAGEDPQLDKAVELLLNS